MTLGWDDDERVHHPLVHIDVIDLRGKSGEALADRGRRGGTMKKATLEKVQARLGEYVAASSKHPTLILRDGQPVAMLVGLDRKERRTPSRLRDVLKRAWKDYEEHGGIP